MPPNRLTPLNSASVLSLFPFKLMQTTVRAGSTIGAGKNDLDCQCPCGYPVNAKITSSRLLSDVLTKEQKRTSPQGAGAAKKAVYVSKDSFLFKGLYPSPLQTIPESLFNDYGTFDSDPILRIYGLDQPIIIEDFFIGEPENSTKTVKIWLTVCFPSGEDGQNLFASCVPKMKNDTQSNIDCTLRALKPQVAFISYGMEFPKDLIVTKTIAREGTVGSSNLRLERRQVEAHVPIGEVDIKGKIVEQYVRQNLTLMDICYNGTPAKYPMAIL